jgi:hypothetical protein
MSRECRFELMPLHCSLCGAYLNQEGTCEDQEHAFCSNCAKQEFDSISTDHIWQPNYDNLDEKGEPKTFKPIKTRI